MSKSLLAAPHSMCELRALLCKTTITIADIIFKPMPHVQVVLYCIACGLLFYYHARMVSSSTRITVKDDETDYIQLDYHTQKENSGMNRR
jgi:hypothetical protein